jgi:dihydrofolate reductase
VQLSIITAFDQNRVIGLQNRLPWSLPADLLRFKRLTWGKPIIMGRNTYESIGRPLPGRKNLILSRQFLEYPGCEVYSNLEEALAAHKDEKEIFIIGGENLYRQTLSRVDRLYLTLIHHQFEGDTYFPEWNYEDWEIIEQEEFVADSQNSYNYTFQTLVKIPSPHGD